MSLSFNQSTQFVINELSIVSKKGKLDIRGLFSELSIFDGILQPCMSGNILVEDAIGLSGELLYDGSEYLIVDISKDGNAIRMNKTFHIYKQSNREILTQSSERYVLHFASDEFIYSEQQRINKSYKDTYSNVAKTILLNELKVPKDKLTGRFEKTLGLRTLNVPVLKPFEAINWCAKRALGQNDLPDFVFFENIDGYNFVSLSTLLEDKSIFNINFSTKNIDENEGKEILGARSFEVISQYDYVQNTKSGVYAGTFTGFDLLTRQYMNKKITFNDIYSKSSHANRNPLVSNYTTRDNKTNTEMINSRKVLFPFMSGRASTEHIRENDQNSISLLETPEKWLFQRQALMQNIMAQRVKVVMPGNFAITSGYNMNLMVPSRKASVIGSDNNDYTLYGKYLVVAVRHIIKFDRHETVLELVTDSTNKPILPQSNNFGTESIF
jgi:hypothetical protein